MTPIFIAQIVMVSAAAVTPGAAGEVVWQIGQPDHDYRDLANAGDLFGGYLQAFPRDVNYVVGRSDPLKDFSAAHPGPQDQWASTKRHPFRIVFDRDPRPAVAYELLVDLVDTQSQYAPTLSVAINNQKTEVPLERGAGDLAVLQPAKGKARSLRFIIPQDVLRERQNAIELIVTEGSWLLYDALSLRRITEETRPEITLKVQPTIFLVEQDGLLKQEFVLSAQGFCSHERVQLEVLAGAEPLQSAPLEEPRLGTFSSRVLIPAAEQSRELTVRVAAAGQRGEVRVQQTPVRKWHIHVIPSTHTDIGYTDLQERVIALHNRNTDLAIALVNQFPLYHWNLESSWAAQMWLRDRAADQHPALIDAAVHRRIGIEGGYLNMLTGLCSEEELIRNLYYSARLQRLHGVPFDSVTLTDAPSHVWTVPGILAGAGIHCLSVGVNQTRAPLFKQNIQLKSPFWWEGPDGGRVLTWLANGYSQAELIGLKGGVDHMREVIESYMFSWNRRTDYPYDAILLHGAYSDNLAIGREMAENITAYARRYAYPKVMLSSNQEFFKHIEQNFSGHIPTVRGCGGSWWEDGAASSAVETAINRRNQHDAIAAETIWGVLSALDRTAAVPQDEFNRIWDNILLYDEHTWGAHNSITHPNSDFVQRQWAVKAAYATQAADSASRLLDRGLRRLFSRVKGSSTTQGGEPAVLVFNPAGRPRSGVVEVDIPANTAITEAGIPVPQQRVREDALNRITVAILAKDVPPAGYRVYHVVPREPVTALPVSSQPNDSAIENAFYRVVLDPVTGAISSLFDKKSGKELVDPGSPYKFGEVIYASGGNEKEGGAVDGTTQVMCPNPAGVQLHFPAAASPQRGQQGPVYRSVRSVSKCTMLPRINLEVMLFEHEPRVDLVFRLEKEMTYQKEALYIAFPVAGANPRFRYEIGGGSVRPNQDHFPGACRDWFAVQRWITVQTDSTALALSPVDTPLVTLCNMNAGKWLDELPITNGTIFAYAMNNYWFTNYKAGQDGPFTFRYSLTTDARIEPAAASRFGDSVQSPLRAIYAQSGSLPSTASTTPGGEGASLPETDSFCEVEPATIEITTLKPADDGKGIILRLHELAGQATEAHVSVKQPDVKEAWRCDLVERDQARLPFERGKISLKLAAHASATIRLR